MKRLPSSATPDDRFDRMYEAIPISGCWIWTGTRDRHGYGRFFIHGVKRGAHQFSYERTHGGVPNGLELDHLCQTPCCVNPSHLEAVTHAENMRRSLNCGGKVNAAKTRCIRGHEFNEENTRVRRGRRICRACQAIRNEQRQKNINTTR